MHTSFATSKPTDTSISIALHTNAHKHSYSDPNLISKSLPDSNLDPL